jgi:hypothetical protein
MLVAAVTFLVATATASISRLLLLWYLWNCRRLLAFRGVLSSWKSYNDAKTKLHYTEEDSVQCYKTERYY